MATSVDEDLRPFIRIALTGESSDGDYEQLLDAIGANLARGERSVFVVDVSDAVRPSHAQLQRIADWMQRNELMMAQLSLGTALVVTTAGMALAMKTLLWLTPFPTPYLIAATEKEAVAWAVARLREADFTLAANHASRRFLSKQG